METTPDTAPEAAAEAEQGRTARALILYLEAAGRAEREQNAPLQEKALVAAVRHCFDQARAHVAMGRFQSEHGHPDAALKSYMEEMLRLNEKKENLKQRLSQVPDFSFEQPQFSEKN